MSQFKISFGSDEQVDVYMLENGRIALAASDSCGAGSVSLTAQDATNIAIALMKAVIESDVMAKEAKP